jgi:hypothetical protein
VSCSLPENSSSEEDAAIMLFLAKSIQKHNECGAAGQEADRPLFIMSGMLRFITMRVCVCHLSVLTRYVWCFVFVYDIETIALFVTITFSRFRSAHAPRKSSVVLATLAILFVGDSASIRFTSTAFINI